MSYYTLEDNLKQLFLQIPKALVFEEKYKKNEDTKALSNDAKVLYSILLDRTSISRENGWIDENNNLYVICRIEYLMEVLNVGNRKAGHVKNELISFGLLEEVKMGQGKPNRYFLKKPYVSLDEDLSEINKKYNSYAKEKTDIKVETHRLSTEKSRSKSISNKSGIEVRQSSKNTLNPNRITSNAKMTLQEMSEQHCINNNLNNNNLNNFDDDARLREDNNNHVLDLLKKAELDKDLSVLAKNKLVELVASYANKFDIDVLCEIFIEASMPNVKNKYAWLRKTLSDLSLRGVKTYEAYLQDKEEHSVKFADISKMNLRKTVNDSQGTNNKIQPKKTKFHNFDETFTQYEEDEFERIIQNAQREKWGDL